MTILNKLSREGAIEVLNRLCLGEARFKDLKETIRNTRTLTRRLNELVADGLIQKAGVHYKIEPHGFEIALRMAELEEETGKKWANNEELAKIAYGWIRISLSRLTELFHEEFVDELVSVVLHGSLVKGSFQMGRSDIDLLYILEDDSKKVWQREANLFKSLQTTWEYKASDYQFRERGFHGHPEITTVWLQKSYAEKFQPIYLDMLFHRAVLYDRKGFFQNLMGKLEKVLEALGTIRIEHPDGTYSWFLKPDITPGELIEINLG